jgi:hypothetical protein
MRSFLRRHSSRSKKKKSNGRKKAQKAQRNHSEKTADPRMQEAIDSLRRVEPLPTILHFRYAPFAPFCAN